MRKVEGDRGSYKDVDVGVPPVSESDFSRLDESLGDSSM